MTDKNENLGPLSGKPPSDWQGPLRRAPHFYAGEYYGSARGKGSYGRGGSLTAPTVRGRKTRGRSKMQVRRARPMQYPDVQRNANGTLPGVRNKAARRLIRSAFKRQISTVERALGLPRAMLAQAREIANEEHVTKIEDYHNGNRSTRFMSTSSETRAARRLFEKELAIHQPVYVPSKKAIRAMRSARRKAKRAGVVQDAIGQLVDRMKK